MTFYERPQVAGAKLHTKAASKQRWQLVRYALSLPMLLLLGPAGSVGVQKQAHDMRALVESSASINLKTIAEHQEGLARECAKFREQELLKLKEAIKFNNQHELEVQLPSLLRVEVPAVCLFIFSQFGRSDPMNVEEAANSNNNKLVLVNWIFDQDQLIQQVSNETTKNNNSSSKSSNSSGDARHKRQALAEEDDETLLAENLLRGFLLNPNSLAATGEQENYDNEVGNSADNEKKLKFHKQIEAMLADERFQRTIEQNRPSIGDYLSPVVLVPGLLGSRLQAHTFKTKRVNIFCQKQNDWQEMWLAIRQLLPIVVDCWLDNVRLEVDPQTGLSKSPPGVETRVPDFGSVESVRYLDLNQPQITQYYAPIIERYQQLGYTIDKNLLAAPYDFRLAPQELANSYYVQLKGLIERAQDVSMSGRPVTLVCHSMGCTHIIIFLRQQSSAWRQKRIRKLIALSSPWGGAIKAVKALTVGDQLNLPFVSETKMRKLARSYPSIAFLLPLKQVFARTNMNHDQPSGPVLVRTPERSYQVGDLKDLLSDLNLTRQYEWFKESGESLIKPLEPLPDVHVDCIYSLNVPTPETLIFRNQTDFPNGNYELVKGEGDGTVNLESLMVCGDWARKLPNKVSHTIIMNTDHVGVLGHKTTLTHITDDVLTH